MTIVSESKRRQAHRAAATKKMCQPLPIACMNISTTSKVRSEPRPNFRPGQQMQRDEYLKSVVDLIHCQEPVQVAGNEDCGPILWSFSLPCERRINPVFVAGLC